MRFCLELSAACAHVLSPVSSPLTCTGHRSLDARSEWMNRVRSPWWVSQLNKDVQRIRSSATSSEMCRDFVAHGSSYVLRMMSGYHRSNYASRKLWRPPNQAGKSEWVKGGLEDPLQNATREEEPAKGMNSTCKSKTSTFAIPKCHVRRGPKHESRSLKTTH